jgi:hypothetical protein
MLQNVEILYIYIFWDVTLWFLAESYQRLCGRNACHIYGKLLSALLIVLKMETVRFPEPLLYLIRSYKAVDLAVEARRNRDVDSFMDAYISATYDESF